MRIAILFIISLTLSMSETNWHTEQRSDRGDTRWYSLEKAQKLAKTDKKKVLVYLYANNSNECHKMTHRVYASEKVSKIIHEHFYASKINANTNKQVTFNGEKLSVDEFISNFNVDTYPTIIFLDSEGETITLQGGFIERETFNKLLVFVGSDAYKRQEFDQFTYQREN